MSDRRFFEILSIHEAVLLHALICQLRAGEQIAETGQLPLAYLVALGKTLAAATEGCGGDKGVELLAKRLDAMVLSFGPQLEYTKDPEEAGL